MKPDDVVGHKTLYDGSHVPLLRHEADELMAACDAAKAKRLVDMPDETAALLHLMEAFTRLKELGWREAIYCPKDGTPMLAIEAGSTGQHPCRYYGEWPDGGWTDGEYNLRPILFKLSPEDEAARKEKMRVAAARFAAMGAE